MKRRRIFLALLSVVALVLAACSSDSATKQSAGTDQAKGSKSAKPDANAHDMTAEEMAAMDGHETKVDDRGFSLLANGMEHGYEFPQAISKADRLELARQLTMAREVALQYPTVADAEAGGLRRAGPYAPGLGAHYLAYANAGGDVDGVMSDDDIRRPLAWIYDGTHPDSRVSGLFYSTPIENSQGFAGPNDTWHLHQDICIVTTATGIDTPLGADHEATTKECDAVKGTLIKQTGYLLHVWVVPGYESPEGVFSHLSSAATCDDGTYNTIEDITKIGTKTTVCADGTE